MRISDSAVFDSIRKQVMRARKELVTAQEQAGTGLRVQRPSDDPVAAAAARRESSRKSLAEAGVKATEAATMQLEGADSALGDVYDGLTRARELALAGASSTYGDENRRNAANEVRKIRDQMVALGNTNVGGRYVFAGYRDDQPAFSPTGAFAGDDSVKEVQAMPGLRVASSIAGEDVFGKLGDEDVFSTLDELARSLEESDMTAISGSLGKLDKGQNRVLDGRSRIGAMIDSVEMANAVALKHGDRAKLEIGRLVDVDEVTAATNLVQAKSALEQALAVAQQIPVGSLAGGK